MFLFEIIVVVFIGYMAFEIADTFGSSETTNKINLANDISLMINTLVSIPGDAVVEYPGNVSKYTFVLTSHAITVFIKDDSEIKRQIQSFHLPPGYSARGRYRSVSSLHTGFPCVLGAHGPEHRMTH